MQVRSAAQKSDYTSSGYRQFCLELAAECIGR